jgi:hypothetical protein
MSDQLDLIHLTVTPEEARMIGTALTLRWYHLEQEENSRFSAYRELGYKVAAQWLNQLGIG